jgi:hypothetical protein
MNFKVICILLDLIWEQYLSEGESKSSVVSRQQCPEQFDRLTLAPLISAAACALRQANATASYLP